MGTTSLPTTPSFPDKLISLMDPWYFMHFTTAMKSSC